MRPMRRMRPSRMAQGWQLQLLQDALEVRPRARSTALLQGPQWPLLPLDFDLPRHSAVVVVSAVVAGVIVVLRWSYVQEVTLLPPWTERAQPSDERPVVAAVLLLRAHAHHPHRAAGSSTQRRRHGRFHSARTSWAAGTCSSEWCSYSGRRACSKAIAARMNHLLRRRRLVGIRCCCLKPGGSAAERGARGTRTSRVAFESAEARGPAGGW